jgi:hypothetical protein
LQAGCFRIETTLKLLFFQVLQLPRISPQEMLRQTRARIAEFRRINHLRGPEANSKTFTMIHGDSHRISLPEGSNLKRQVQEEDLKRAGQLFAIQQGIMKAYSQLDAAEQKFIGDVYQLWSQDLAEMQRQVTVVLVHHLSELLCSR